MPKPLSDDLRCRILRAYARQEESQAELARRFGVSFEYVRKVRRQWRLSGRMERVPQSRHGRLSRITTAVREQLRDWVREQPDRTLAELGEQLQAQGVAVSRSRISQILQQMGLRRGKKVAPRPGARQRGQPQAPGRIPLRRCGDPSGEAEVSR
jgi:transposase